MKKLLTLFLWLSLACAPFAFAQQVVVPFSSLAGAPGGTTGQIQFNAGAGSFGGFTANGGATINTSTGVVTLGNPGASILGGIESIASISHEWINSISTAGVPGLAQPDFSDLSGLASAAQMETNLIAALNAELSPGATAFIAGNGSSWTSRSIVSGDLPLGTSSAPGAVQCDNTSIICTAGVISTAAATYPTAGDILIAPTSGAILGLAPVSGGVVYGSSSSAFAVSAALAANKLVLGGGAGAAPSTEADWTLSSHNLIGTLNAAALPAILVPGIQVGGADTTSSGYDVDTFAATPVFGCRRADNTNASKSAVVNNDVLCALQGYGWNTSAYALGASINEIATQTWTTGAEGNAIVFNTTANGSTTPAANVKIDQNGALLIGTSPTNPGANGLDITGPTTANQQSWAVTTLTMSASTVATNAALGNIFIGTMVHADSPYTISNPTNLIAGQYIEYIFTESSTGGDTIGSWGTDFAFPYGTPVFNPVANAVNTVYCKAQGTGAGGLICANTPWFLHSNTNCASAASPAVCGSAQAGAVAVPAGTNTTLTVNTTAVTANSQILLTFDASLGTRLSVTCNTAPATFWVSARVAGTSFTIEDSSLTTNPGCFNYLLVN